MIILCTSSRNYFIYYNYYFSEHKNIYLPLDDDSDAYLYAYLRACKYYVSSAFERVSTKCDFSSCIKNEKHCSS